MITVIVPIYNSEKYLSGCLQSICSQTYDNIEILLIDDGSTDSSWEICNRFAAADSRIIIVQKENGGQSSARNLGLDMATGDYIAFIDSDDAISADVLEKAMSQFEQHPHVDAVQFPVFMEYGTAGQYLKVKKEKLITGTANLFSEWIEKGIVSWIVCNKIFRREVFENLRFQKMYYEDNFITVEILSKISTLFIMEEGIYYYYSRQDSTTTSPHSLQKELDTQKVNFKIYEQVEVLGLSGAMTLMQEKILNVGISLLKNFSQKSLLFPASDINIRAVLASRLPRTQKIKLLLYKFLGCRLFSKFYHH